MFSLICALCYFLLCKEGQRFLWEFCFAKKNFFLGRWQPIWTLLDLAHRILRLCFDGLIRMVGGGTFRNIPLSVFFWILLQSFQEIYNHHLWSQNFFDSGNYLTATGNVVTYIFVKSQHVSPVPCIYVYKLSVCLSLSTVLRMKQPQQLPKCPRN